MESVGAAPQNRAQDQREGNILVRLAADGEHLEPDPAEQEAVAEIRKLRQAGRTLRGIAATLNSRGHRTRSTAWRLESVARVVTKTADGAGNA